MEGAPSAPACNHRPPSAVARPAGHCPDGSTGTWAWCREPEPLPQVGVAAGVCVRGLSTHRQQCVCCGGVLLLNSQATGLPREPALPF